MIVKDNSKIMLNTVHNIFIVGIKGVGMANLALILSQMGKNVSGSDTDEKFITDEELTKSGIKIITGFDPADILSDTQLVVYSASHKGMENPQVLEAIKRTIPVMHQAKIIEEIVQLHKISIAVCGSHGKTTTTSLLAHILSSIEKDKVSYLAGTSSFNGKPAGKYGDGSIFVFEADEYGLNPPQDKTPKFHLYHPDYILCTNIDFDHPDVYQNLEEVKESFKRFFHNAKKEAILCEAKKLTDNTSCVVSFLKKLGYQADQIQQGLSTFKSVKRRFEKIGEVNGAMVFDDYAHHPKEIEATLEAAREKFPGKKFIVVFQPHTFSRTQALEKEFIHALSQSDTALILPIFASAREEKKKFTITSEKLVQVAEKMGIKNIIYVPTNEAVLDKLRQIVSPGTVIFTMGAGDVYKMGDDIIKTLQISN